MSTGADDGKNGEEKQGLFFHNRGKESFYAEKKEAEFLGPRAEEEAQIKTDADGP